MSKDEKEFEDREFNVRLLFAPDYTSVAIVIDSDSAIDERDFKWVLKKISKLKMNDVSGEDLSQ